MPEKWRIDQFEQYLMVGDDLADQAAKDLFQSDRKHVQSFRSMNKVLERGIDKDDDIPDSFRKLIEQVSTDPVWLNRELVEKGARVCHRLGGHAMMVLGDMALAGGYANSDITKPLIFTGALKGAHTFDRVSETSQFWVNVTRKGALQIGEKGFRSAVRVRMMHAIVRLRLVQHPKWDFKAWGWPINEADSLATNVGFSMAMLYGTKRLGYHLPDDEIEAVLHLWRHIGYLMGNDTSWLPKNAEEGLRSLLLVFLSNDNIADEECKTLARDYLNSFKPKEGAKDWQVYTKEYYYFLKHKAYAEYLIPFDMYKSLDLPSSSLSWLLIPLLESPGIFIKDRLRTVFPGLEKWMEKEGAKEQEQVVIDRMGNKEASFVPKEKMAV